MPLNLEHMTCHWMSESYTGDFLWQFVDFFVDNFYNIWQFWQFLTICDNFWQFQFLWTIFENFDIFLNLDFFNFDNLYKSCNLLTIFTFFLSFFTHFTILEKFYNIGQFSHLLTIFDTSYNFGKFWQDNDNPRDLWPFRHWLQFWQSLWPDN